MFLIVDAQGQPRSFGTVVATELPPGWTVREIPDPGPGQVWSGTAWVNPPSEPTVRERFLAQTEIAALTAAQRTNVMKAFDRVVG